ncbi:MAG: DUF2723 domain-containing protein [Thiohalocapsa sp.]
MTELSETSRQREPSAQSESPHLFAVFFPLLLLYWFTAPRTVVLEDDGLFILSSWFLGIEHPPGYPLFVLLGKLATLVPVGSAAWRVHALNGLFAASTCVLVYLISRRLTPGRMPAYLAAFGLGLSETFWSQALIADVYPLHGLLFFALLYLAILQHQGQPPNFRATDRRMLLTALLLGLGFSNHWPLLVLSGLALLLLWLPDYRQILRHLPRLVAVFALGLLPYAWMVWRSQQQPEISFQGPIDSWAEFVGYVLRSGYVGVDDTASSGADDRLLYLSYLVRQAGAQLLLPGGALALIGALAQWRHWGVLTSAALSAAFLGSTLLLTLLLGFDYQPLQREAFRVYPLVAWGVFALWAGLGTKLALDLLAEHLPSRWRKPAGAALVALLIGLTLAVHWERNDRHDDRLAHTYATTLLAGLEPNARLLIKGDITVPSTAYLHRIEGLRPDVSLVTEDGRVLERRLFDPVRTRGRKRFLDAYIASSDQPLYRLHNRDARAGTRSWLLFRVDLDSVSGTHDVRFEMTTQERQFLIWLAQIERFQDGWNEMLRRALLVGFTDFQTRAALHGQWSIDDAELEAVRKRILRLPEAALTRAELLFATDADANAAEIDRLISQFAQQATDPELSKRQQARFYNLLAQIAQQQGREEAFRAAVQASLDYWPEASNPAAIADRRLCQRDPNRQAQ